MHSVSCSFHDFRTEPRKPQRALWKAIILDKLQVRFRCDLFVGILIQHAEPIENICQEEVPKKRFKGNWTNLQSYTIKTIQ